MPFQPIAEDKYNSLIQKGYSHDDIMSFENQRKQDSVVDVQKPLSITDKILPQFMTGAEFPRGERTVLGNIFERPGAAIRSTLLGNGYAQGASVPEEVPRFQDVALDKYYGAVGKGTENLPPILRNLIIAGSVPGGMGVSAGGMAADVATNPADIFAMLVGKAPMGGGKTLGGVLGATKPVQAVSRFANLPLEETAPGRAFNSALSSFKKSGVFKQNRDYIADVLSKPAADYSNAYIKRYPEEAQRTLNLKPETVDLIKKHGFDRVADYQSAKEAADGAYDLAMAQKTNVYGNKIDVRDTLKKAQSLYNSTKKVTPNNSLLGVIEDIKKLVPAPKGFYSGVGKENIPSTAQLLRLFRGEKLTDIAGEVRLTRQEFSALRSRLQNLHNDPTLNPDKVYDLVDTLYSDGEKAGLKGLQEARRLTKEAYQFKKIAPDIRKMDKITPEKIYTAINQVIQDPGKYKIMIERFSPYMGKTKAEELFKQALSVRHGRQVIRLGKTGIGLTAAGAIGKKALDVLH
jgi:hypothetical protein